MVWCRTCMVEYRKVNADDIKAKVKLRYPKIFARRKERYATDPAYKQKEKEWSKLWSSKNREHCNKLFRLRYAALSPEKKAKLIKRTKEWGMKDGRKKQYFKEWRQNNKDKKTHEASMRRAARIQRTPCWLTEDDKLLIQRKYTLAQKKTESTGEKWVVDHIFPLRGKLVSGLHVPANLRVIKESTNLRKSNKFVPV